MFTRLGIVLGGLWFALCAFFGFADGDFWLFVWFGVVGAITLVILGRLIQWFVSR